MDTTDAHPEKWTALSELSKMTERELRRELRTHIDVGFNSPAEIDLRRRFDAELAEITAIELRAQAGAISKEEAKQTLRSIPHFASLIQKSHAFVQYLNSYLYFGVRFAANRLGQSDAASKDKQYNERPTALPQPPHCEGPSADALRDDVQVFLDSGHSEETAEALDFLDDYIHAEDAGEWTVTAAGENAAADFDLWLRGLLPYAEDPERAHRMERFPAIARGLYQWAEGRYQFYLSLEHQLSEKRVNDWLGRKRMEGEWHARNPLAARCGVAELYWLAKILRAEITARGTVRYAHRSWLLRLSEYAPGPDPMGQVLRMEEVLRSVFDYACELIQNAVQIAEYRQNRDANPEEYDVRPSKSLGWRAVQDGEIEEIGRQRRERQYPEGDSKHLGHHDLNASDGSSDEYWNKRIRTGEYEENLVGLALSGGGIRSATFALGVLQHLKDLDLLRSVDFLSTVSGGGYIGAWLMGNVYRTRYWLSRMTTWDESIGWLRNFSKYLAPQSGFLSADSWVIWGTWIRNATLIQLTAAAWLLASFVSVFLTKAVFVGGNAAIDHFERPLLTLAFLALAWVIGGYLANPAPRPPTQHRKLVLLTWTGSFLVAALLWRLGVNDLQYSKVLQNDFFTWPLYLGLFAGMFLLADTSVGQSGNAPEKDSVEKVSLSIGAAALSTGILYLAICGVHYLFGTWSINKANYAHYSWYAYVFGPALVMLSLTVSLVVFIGLIGRSSADWRREWWTRYGAWLSIFGAGFMALGLAAVFGSVWLGWLICKGKTVSWGAAAGWAASSIGGLLAGNSSRTKGDDEGSSQLLEWASRIGGALFIVGAVIGLSRLLQVVLANVWVESPTSNWWDNLNALIEAGPTFTIPFVGVMVHLAYFALPISFGLLVACGFLFSWRFDLNTFGLNQFYRNRLVRCYLGATQWMPGLSKPDRFTGFDEHADFRVDKLKWKASDDPPFRGPFHIVNCSLNLGGSSDLAVKTRQSASFTITPLACGSDRHKLGYAPVRETEGFGDGIMLGQAISISGAAASPNMGYNTSPLVSVLLTMFNVRLAWWFPNPGRSKWQKSSPPVGLLYLVQEFLGLADETSDFVNVSDGGHFENLGIYELIRRRTKVIIASDAECDPGLAFGSLGNVIRICDTDFGAKIDIDVESIRKGENGLSRAHCAVGRITYSNGSLGYLIYLKSSLTGDEDLSTQQYHSAHPDFPHESTGDQFFTEDQFESYRQLGYHIAKLAFRAADPGSNLVATASKLYDVWTPAGVSSDTFIDRSKALDELWERLSASPALSPLLTELLAGKMGPAYTAPLSNQELCACLELAQLMENVFLGLRLEDFWEHPDHRGWAMLFIMWAQSPRFVAAWKKIRRTFGIPFEYFCEHRLGLSSERPVAKV